MFALSVLRWSSDMRKAPLQAKAPMREKAPLEEMGVDSFSIPRHGSQFWVCITFCMVRNGDRVAQSDFFEHYLLASPVDIGRKPTSPARGVGNAYTPAEASFTCNTYTPTSELVNGTTWRRPLGAWGPEVDISRTDIHIINLYILTNFITENWVFGCLIVQNPCMQIISLAYQPLGSTHLIWRQRSFVLRVGCLSASNGGVT